MVDLVGQQLSNYRVVRQLGQGGFGDVYLGEHTYLKSLAAIKVLHTALSDKHKASFLKEAQHLVGLRHSHIVRFLEFGFEGDFPFLIMEYAPNGTLRTRHPKGTRLPLEQIVHYVKQIAPALDYAHQQRVIHRDVKPENMLLSATDEVVLSDFGIAVVQQTMNSLSTQNQAGTPVYMAPEQIGGKPCAASDQYALGVLVYEWLCGDLPFRGSPLQVFNQHLHETPPSLCDRVPSLPPAVEDAVFGALAKEPQARFVSVQEFAEVLEEVWHTTQSRSSDVSAAPLSREQGFRPVPTSVPSPEEPKRSQSGVQRPSVWNVPYPRNPFFTGREQLLAQLATALQRAPAALTQPQAISGLGGIGKTQLAVEYAYRSYADYQAVLWVRADTRENIVSDFVTMAGLLALPEKNEQDQMMAVQAVKEWLRTRAKWLLILDNADELAMVREFLPSVHGGHLLLTTRAQAMGRLARRIEVEKLEIEVGALFLLRRAALLAPDASLEQALLPHREAALDLTRELDGLPLALDQAGAYIEETSCGIGDYLRLYRQQRGALLARRGGLVADHPSSVSTTWSLSFQQVEQRNPAAADLLRVCAFLHPDAIPEALLTEGAFHLGPQLASFATDELAFNEAISALHRYSLMRRDLADKTLSLHRLVQAVLKDAMSEETQQMWAERVVRAVNVAFPEEVEFSTWERCRAYLPHVLACDTLVESHRLALPEAANLLSRAGKYLEEHAQYTQAESLYQRALTMSEEVHGPDHPETSGHLLNLAYLYLVQGRYEEAEPLYQRALAINEQAFGSEHPSTARALRNLVYLYRVQGRYAEAERLGLRALAINEQAFGLEHPTTVGTLNQLAELYQEQGRYEKAEPLYQRVLAIDEHDHRPHHYNTAWALGNLADLYRYQGKYEQAEPLFQRALVIEEQTLGPDHPQTAKTLDQLAGLYRMQKRYGEAESLFQHSLAIYEQAFGPDCPDIAATLDQLADLYRDQGKDEQAELFHQQALAIEEKVLGPDHPNTARTLYYLANLYLAQERYEEAEPLYQRTLAIEEKVLGPDHLYTAIMLENYAALLRTMQRPSEAIPLEQRALAIRAKQQLF